MKKLGFYFFMFVQALGQNICAQHSLKSYQFYYNGGPVSFGDAIKFLGESDVILFGEFHNHAMIHWLQLKTAQKLLERSNLIIGAEFFETDDQLLLDELIAGLTPLKKFEDEAKLWPNFETDYKPLVQLAVDSQLTFVATNIPRRYASFIAQHGLDTLESFSQEALSLLPPLPMPFSMDTPGYQEVFDMMGEGHGMSSENFVKAQAVKDYTMAFNIGQSFEAGSKFLHINGNFHSKDFGGIYWYLNLLYPELQVQSIKVIQLEDMDVIEQEEFKGGDLILAVPIDFPKSY